jgi:uncharacterized protein YkwD
MVLLLVMGATTLRPSSRLLASSVANDGGAGQSAKGATLKPAAATSPDIPFSDYDPEAEQQLLDLANQARAQAGAPRLTLDVGLSKAARAHARAMSAAVQLSHQFDGEPSLPQRLASVAHTPLDQEGENVALDYDAAQAEQHLMLSPPHRANLLNPAYNVVGLGVVRSGDRIYIVQDFGHALPNYSPAEVKERVAATVAQARRQTNQPDLARRDLATADDTACSMAKAGKLGTPSVHQLAQHYTVFTYTSLHPETLPASAGHALAGHNLQSFSVGTCYGRTETYPTGVYWVVLSLE